MDVGGHALLGSGEAPPGAGGSHFSPPAEEGRGVNSDTFKFQVVVATRDFMICP